MVKRTEDNSAHVKVSVTEKLCNISNSRINGTVFLSFKTEINIAVRN